MGILSPMVPYRRRSPLATAAASRASTTESPPTLPPSTPRTLLPWSRTTRIRDLLANPDLAGKTISLNGWVRTVRDQKKVVFLNLNDGSSVAGIQCVLRGEIEEGQDSDLDLPEGLDLIRSGSVTLGAAVQVTGLLTPSKGNQAKQTFEIQVDKLHLIGACPSDSYPLQKKKTSLGFLRSIAHLRPRTNTIGAAQRVRSTLAFATHEFFQGEGFSYLNSPILSTSDCEGAGEMFQVTTLLAGKDEATTTTATAIRAEMGPGAKAELETAIASQGEVVRAAKKEGEQARIAAEVEKLLALKAKLAAGVDGALAGSGAPNPDQALPRNPDGSVDYTQDFFGRKAFLTVSGQLQGEIYATAMGDVYTFGPTFRAENSNTSRHLAEFWMVEPEMAFCDLERDMSCAEAYLKHCLRSVLEKNPDDMAFFDSYVKKGNLDQIASLLEKPFATMTYTDAVAELSQAKKKFEYPVVWGKDLQSEHERYLTEVVCQGVPVMVTDYPQACKAFYMRGNDDGVTCAAMDMLVPGVGELIGGSQREERLDVLMDRMRQAGLDPEPYWWYLDLRKYGSVPHAGFGLGFERLVQYTTGLDNIRDVIPFPRYPGNATF